jgi:hypothetical protein
MSRRWFASNARDMLEARRRGFTPDCPVVVTMVGGSFEQPTLYVQSDMPANRLDWSMLVNVDVWVWASFSESVERIAAVVQDIAKAKPRSLFLRFEDRDGHVHDVDCGSGTHRPGLPEHGIPAEHSFIFCPINSAGTKLGSRLRNALARTSPGDQS